MPKPSSRFRTRKINFKTAIPVYVGSFELPFEDELSSTPNAFGGSPGPSGSASAFGGASPAHPSSNGAGLPTSENGEAIRVETGVDKEEEREHHLQAVISASAAALQRSSFGRSVSGASNGPTQSKALLTHIPTPDATGVVADWERLYPHNAYVDPHGYIRFSATVEETMGIPYTMDEEDEDWLEDYNLAAKDRGQDVHMGNGDDADENKPPASLVNGTESPKVFSKPSSPAGTPSQNGNVAALAASHKYTILAQDGHYPPLGPLSAFKAASRKRKQLRESSQNPSLITEDDFELIMDLLERATDRKTPTLHSDVSRIPTLEDLEPSFAEYLPSYLLKIAKNLARAIYPHWKTRRINAGGKNINPQLDHDMTTESPYVCFRRREVKTVRKTRRTDTQTIEKLVRLKSDLTSAQELLLKVLEREKCKRDSIIADGKIFEERVRMRTIKRKLGEAHGDEALLIPRREKKRKSGIIPQAPLGANKIVIPNRTTLASLAPGLLPDPLPPYKDKTAYAVQRIDKDMQRKREQEFGWEDMTDSAFLPLPQPLPSRFWRAPERLYRYSEGRKPAEIVTFDQYNSQFIQIVGQRYRKRVGRGGRIHLDRLSSRRVASDSSDEEDEHDEEAMQRMRERWRYDADIPQELPSTRFPMVLDDFDTKFAATRSRMLAASDWESVYPATVHIEEAMRWTMREPDRPPPMQVIGKLPGQRIHAFMNGQANGGVPPHQQQQQQIPPQQHGNNAAQMAAAVAAATAAAAASGNRMQPGQGVQGIMQAQQQQQQQQQQTGGRRSSSSNNPGGVGSNGHAGGGQAPPMSGTPTGSSAPSPGLGPPQQPQIRRLMWENGG
ncbi:hypothetical protein P389DRAFT_31800 [Cystobasidium minutum MCA 4210]|uniref:uncharacterized protein n=1 Tax=Cystobasidium minutum MCA 4210 TaxID=1397322 RepID=UPI0034CFBBBD|eukprot:jgi/Rhomi1/31800/CE31799_3473